MDEMRKNSIDGGFSICRQSLIKYTKTHAQKPRFLKGNAFGSWVDYFRKNSNGFPRKDLETFFI